MSWTTEQARPGKVVSIYMKTPVITSISIVIVYRSSDV